MMNRQRLEQLREIHRVALLDDVVPFWERHSVDREHGGFFMCLARDGSLYSTDKPVWLQGRATWLFATLYDRVAPRAEWLDLARRGCEFMNRHCFDERGKMYFLVARDGRPLRMRRYVYSEVFATLGYAALAKVTGDAEIRRRAVEVFDSFVRYTRTPGLIEPKMNPQVRPMQSLSPRMCLLNMADTMLMIDDDPRYERLIDECVADIFRDFVKLDEGCVIEHVGPDGERVDAPEGRVMNPGHAIEVAWFIMEIGRRRGDRDLVARGARILDLSLARGWDPQYGGLLYFLDVDGKPATQLEHDMKLWWPHSEALYATLLAYHLTGDAKYAGMYEQVHEWTFAHFPDREFGEWFGYLHRDGTVSTPLKGGIWKGPFHIPRALLYCWKLLEEMAS